VIRIPVPFWIESKVAVSVSHNLTISQKRYSAGISFPCPYDDFVAQRFACLVEFSNIISERPSPGDFVKTVTSISRVFEVFCVKTEENKEPQENKLFRQIERSVVSIKLIRRQNDV